MINNRFILFNPTDPSDKRDRLFFNNYVATYLKEKGLAQKKEESDYYYDFWYADYEEQKRWCNPLTDIPELEKGKEKELWIAAAKAYYEASENSIID